MLFNFIFYVFYCTAHFAPSVFLAPNWGIWPGIYTIQLRCIQFNVRKRPNDVHTQKNTDRATHRVKQHKHNVQMHSVTPPPTQPPTQLNHSNIIERLPRVEITNHLSRTFPILSDYQCPHCWNTRQKIILELDLLRVQLTNHRRRTYAERQYTQGLLRDELTNRPNSTQTKPL